MDGRSVYDQRKERWRENSPRTEETKMEHGYDGWRSDSVVNSADSTQGLKSSALGLSEARRSSHTVYGTADLGMRSRDRQSNVSRSSRFDDQSSSKYYDDGRFLKSRVDNNDEYSGRRSPYSKPRSRDNIESERRSRGREHRGRREDHEHSKERDHSKRRSRSRDRDRRKRDSDLDRRHRDSDRNRHQRERDRVKRDRSSSPKDIPWVPPPLPEHLRQLQVQWALTPVKSDDPSSSIPQAPVSTVQNQFQNDGSFMEMFKQKMQNKASAVQSPNDSAPVQLESSAVSSTSLKAAETKPGLSATLATSSGMPVIAKRRITKILKTGVVQKKKPASEEPDDKEGVSSSYMKEVQKYRANKCIENEASRPPLVK